jgi:hypothetical protein
MNPRDWNGEHDAWFRLLMGCKFVGITCEEFVEWSTQDQRYANDAEIISRKWESVEPRHGGAFEAALKQRGIKVRQHKSSEHKVLEHGGSTSNRQHTLNGQSATGIARPIVKPRIDGLLRKLAQVATEPMLFSASCRLGQ